MPSTGRSVESDRSSFRREQIAQRLPVVALEVGLILEAQTGLREADRLSALPGGKPREPNADEANETQKPARETDVLPGCHLLSSVSPGHARSPHAGAADRAR